MSHLLLSFRSGIVRPLLATEKRPAAMGKFSEEAVARCKNMDDSATVVDKETFVVIGRVGLTGNGYAYFPTETPA